MISIASYARQNGTAGRVIAIIFKKAMKIVETSNYIFNTMECSDKVQINLYIIYRKPDNSVLTLIGECGIYMKQNITISSETIFIGNFSLHVDNAETSDTPNCQDCLDSFNLVNIVQFGMHKSTTHWI